MRWLRWAVPVLLLAVLWHVAGGEKALARLRAADPLWLLVALAALHAQTLLSALRWRAIAQAMGQPMPRGHALREYYMAQIVNQTLPGGVVGDGARALRAAPLHGVSGAVAAVVLERALGQAALLVLLLAGLAGSLAFGRIPWPAGMPLLILLGVATLAGAAYAARARLQGLRRTIAPAFALPGQKLRLAVLSAGIVALNLASFAATAHATGTTLTLEAITTLIPLILTAMLIPLSIGGWGWREGAAAALFPLAGSTADAGLIASATYGVLILLAALPGAFWLTRPTLRPPAP